MKKKIFLVIVIILFILIISLISLFLLLNERDNKISLIEDNIIIEYGNTYNPTLEELIDLSKFEFVNPEKVKIESNIKNEDNKDYPAVGRYQIIVNYKKRILTQEVEIKDTTKPEINIKENIEINGNTDLSTFNFKELITATDLSEIKNYEFDYSQVDTTKSGKYIVKVYVEDIYSNKNEKEFEITILEMVEETKENEQNIPSSNVITNNSKPKQNDNNVSKKNTTTTTNSSSSKQQENNMKNEYEKPKVENSKTWCDEGGTKHWKGTGKNEHGYYNTWDAAWEAAKVYMKDLKSGNYAVRQCPCGLYYFWVEGN